MTTRSPDALKDARNATMDAMNVGRPFSWLDDRDVQKGVYLKYTQSHWAKYEMPRRMTAQFLGK